MSKNIRYLLLLVLAGFITAMAACKKYEVTHVTYSKFNAASGAYYVTNDANSTFKIPVGITSVSDKPITLNISVSSPSGAASGTQYTLPSSSVTIPAGEVVDSFTVKGIFSGYPTGRKDTLNFTIASSDVTIFNDYKTYQLTLQKYCPVVLDDLKGDFANTADNPGGGPYTATVVSYTSLTATTANIVVRNLAQVWMDDPSFIMPDITVKLDWTDPSNFRATIPTQTIEPTDFYGYGPATINDLGGGKFSSCDGTITLNYTFRVSAGSFGTIVTKLTR